MYLSVWDSLSVSSPHNAHNVSLLLNLTLCPSVSVSVSSLLCVFLVPCLFLHSLYVCLGLCLVVSLFVSGVLCRSIFSVTLSLSFSQSLSVSLSLSTGLPRYTLSVSFLFLSLLLYLFTFLSDYLILCLSVFLSFCSLYPFLSLFVFLRFSLTTSLYPSVSFSQSS